MKKVIIITSIVAVLAIIALIIVGRINKKKDIANLYAEVKKGQFEIVVSTTGELQAEKSTDITGPDFRQSRQIRAMDIKITDLVPEGTVVKSGDYIATLDRTSFDNTLKDELDRLTTYETNLEVKTLDTAVTLSDLRDNIKNLKFSVEEAEITLQQSKYEPPTTIRQAEISLDKAKRSLEQAIKGYSLKVEQARSDMKTIKYNLSEQRQKVADLQAILANFVIKAPADGMVIYKRDRTNAKRKVGSSISPWDNVVATLPDMSSMISKTYVNEIDVSKVKAGQKVEIMVDAFPEKSYTGVVSSVANIGEQLPNADAKVFEVVIKIDGTDPILRPSMTTGNKIVTKTIEDVTYIPLESVQRGADSIPYVYTKGRDKQIVVLGEENENNVIIEQGLNPGDKIFLSTPENPERFKLAGQELIAVNQERAKARKEEELKAKQEAEKERQAPSTMEGMTPEMMQKFQNMRGNMPQGGMPGGQGMQRGQGTQGGQSTQGGQFRQSGQTGPRDTAAFRRMMRNNPEMMQRMMSDTAARRRFMNQMRQNRQNQPQQSREQNQN
ncbi:MAG: HlyD family efflux transporter periplasmic adaptor subunit [Bacteroidota bacterium]|nr:HlyD family efflux transporter periplasmic adaptor subunit [Bacteroidota bacterium]